MSSHEALEAVWSNRLRAEGEYVQVPTSLFVNKIDINMPDLPYMAFFVMRDGKIALLKGENQAYSPLALSLHEHIWIRTKDLQPMRQYAEDRILAPGYVHASHASPEKKVSLLRQTALRVVDELFQNPSPENLARSSKVVNSFVYLLMKDPGAYQLLSKLSSHDPYTLQHTVGTAVTAIIVARKIGFQDEQDLRDIGYAGLLHDIGKVKIRKEILNKDGPLDEHEWEEMRTHAQVGYDMLKDNPIFSERVKRAVLEHHEDKNGTGYPKGLKESEVTAFTKIITICDIFNALTTDRTYSKAKNTFEAFQYIRDHLTHKVDEKIFKQLVLIYGGAMN